MVFILKGNLCGYLCNNFHEGLSNVVVKVYLPDNTLVTTERMTKYSLEVLDGPSINKKGKHLLEQEKTDNHGNYEIKLPPSYKGGPVSLDIVVTQVPNQKVKISKSIQFTLTTLQPVWRDIGQDKSYSWDYCLPYTFWGRIRTAFDAWMVCGYIKSALDHHTPMNGVKVSLYDADWINDDFLGATFTDSSGYFRIDYSSADFKKTFLSPLINVETPFSLIPGPGIYFIVESDNGDILYKEGRKEGKMKERRKIPNCYSVDLYV